jgi:hypothetical protein
MVSVLTQKSFLVESVAVVLVTKVRISKASFMEQLFRMLVIIFWNVCVRDISFADKFCLLLSVVAVVLFFLFYRGFLVSFCRGIEEL